MGEPHTDDMYVHVHTRMYWMLLCVLSVQKDLVTQRVQPWTINLFHEYNKDGDHSSINHGPISSVATVMGYRIAKTVPMLSSVHLQKEKWLPNSYWELSQPNPDMAMLFSPFGCTNVLPLSNSFCSRRTNLPRTWLEVTLQLIHTHLFICPCQCLRLRTPHGNNNDKKPWGFSEVLPLWRTGTNRNKEQCNRYFEAILKAFVYCYETRWGF